MAAHEGDPTRVLILGGTGESLALAAGLAERPGLQVITSLAGRTRAPADIPGAVRIGGFGGAEGLARYLRDQAIDLVVDATHPFAAVISGNAARACETAARPRLRLARPAWSAVEGDQWIPADSTEAAACLVTAHGRRVFLTVGRQEVGAFADLSGTWFLVRLIDPPAAPLPLGDHAVILGRGPFGDAEEVALLRQHRIDLVVSKNSGGAATYGKIAAARALGLPVLMIEQPAAPGGESVESVEAALGWVAKEVGT